MSTKHRPTILAPLTVIGLALLMAVNALAAATPETYYFFVFSNPVAGQETRYNKWYNEQHQLDVFPVHEGERRLAARGPQHAKISAKDGRERFACAFVVVDDEDRLPLGLHGVLIKKALF